MVALRSSIRALLEIGLAGVLLACTPSPTKESPTKESPTKESPTKEEARVAPPAPAVGASASATPTPPASATPSPPGTTTKTVYDFTLDTIDGSPRSLDDFRGKVLLLVNTASECGYTPQYEGLQRLQATHEKRGFSVIAFPSNDFGGQEPGSNQEIKQFCSTKFGVTFPLFAKITVKGPSKHPLYAMLSQTAPAGDVKWNFAKFLVGRDGRVLARYDSDVTPSAPVLLQAIDKALGG
jgi:glutathione peroxidase